MPTYQYACTNPECGNEFELVQSFTDPNASECPVCGGPVRKVFSAVGVVFKGSGFYHNDSRASSGSKSGSSASADSKSTSDSSSSDSSASSSSSSDGAAKSGSKESSTSSSASTDGKSASSTAKSSSGSSGKAAASA